MSLGSESTRFDETFARPEAMLRVPVGLASPLWGLFAGAAMSGTAWWWMSRWARPANLEALFGAMTETTRLTAPAEIAAVETAADAKFAADEAVAETQAAIEQAAAEVEAAAEAVAVQAEAAAEAVVDEVEAAAQSAVETPDLAALAPGESGPISPALFAVNAEPDAPPAPTKPRARKAAEPKPDAAGAE